MVSIIIYFRLLFQLLPINNAVITYLTNEYNFFNKSAKTNIYEKENSKNTR